MNQTSFYEAKLKYEIDSYDLSEAIKNNEEIIVIDARGVDAFNSEHIPNAISFPHRTMSLETTSHLDKSM